MAQLAIVSYHFCPENIQIENKENNYDSRQLFIEIVFDGWGNSGAIAAYRKYAL